MRISKPYNLTGDKYLFFLPLAISLFGVLIILNVSSVVAVADFQNKFYFFGRQFVSFILGTVLFLFFSFFNLRYLKKIALPLFLLNLVFLILVLLPGFGREVYGGKRWLQLGPIGFQPSETAKLSLVIYLSSLFEKKKVFLSFLFLCAIILFLVMLEPDLGTALIILFSACCLFFVSKASLKQILAMIFSGAAVIPLLVITSPYRKQRFVTFMNSFFNPNIDKTSYHVKQILIALGSGGFWGRGFGQSRQKFLFLPEVATDSIFAVVAEEFGFLGALFFILTIVFLFYRGFLIALRAREPFDQMLAAGIVFFLSFQALINLASIVSLIPLTGVPLPFVSYGGSSLIVSLAGMGIVYNISRGQRV